MLEGKHVVLRAAKSEDLPALAALRNDLEVQLTLMATPRPQSEDQVREWLVGKSTDPKGAFFVIAAPEDDKTIGFMQLTGIDVMHGYADLGICLSATARGGGRAQEAMVLLEGYAAQVLKLRKIVLRVLLTNGRAISLYEKCGYRRVGVLQGHHYMGGKYEDVLLMEKPLERAGA
jgi:RimJ/RimL family protein N-acetyltransferase